MNIHSANPSVPLPDAGASCDDPALAYANFASVTGLNSIPDDILHRARHHILDAVGVGILSTKYDFAHRSLTAIAGISSSGLVPVIGMPVCLPARDAAFMNGLLCHGLDYDDTHIAGIVHPTASVFPTVLSAGVHAGHRLGEVLAAYVIGVEVVTRIAMVARGKFHEVGFHPTAVAGVFGCSIAAGRLFSLPVPELVHAQGIALSFASGSLEFLEDGAWTKRIHPGWAAQSGITAAVLARQGFIGAKYPYRGRFGLYNAYIGAHAGAVRDESAGSLGKEWELLGTAIKPYPVCHLTHGAIDAAIELHKLGLDSEQIRQIEVLIPTEIVKVVCEPEESKREPRNDYDARFSLPYLVAAALLKGRITLTELEAPSLANEKILALARLVEYQVDPNATFPRAYSGEVIVRMANGRVERYRQAINRGAAERPLSNSEIIDKFRDNTASAIGLAKAKNIERSILESANDVPVAELTPALVG